MFRNFYLTLVSLLFFVSCATERSGSRMDNPNGDYTPGLANPWYITDKGTLQAFDGTYYYVLQNAEYNYGTMSGAQIIVPECWYRVEVNQSSWCYRRTPETFRNCSKKPIFYK